MCLQASCFSKPTVLCACLEGVLTVVLSDVLTTLAWCVLQASLKGWLRRSGSGRTTDHTVGTRGDEQRVAVVEVAGSDKLVA